MVQYMYVVFEDYKKADDPKVHRLTCGHYQRWKENGTTTTTWHGPYSSPSEAWDTCQTIAKRQGMHPRKAQCCMSD